MCAIFGILGQYEPQKAQEAFGLLRHRGPDDARLILTQEAAFGVHRLAIESAGTPMAQPLVEGDVTLLFNGEIYNHASLATELEIPKASEVEVLLAAWRRWGEEFTRHLRGMYALAIYERQKRRLHLFRDPVGKKPLFYLQQDSYFAFASEAKALYALKPLQIERRQLARYLGYQSTIAPDTLDKEIKKLMPGASLRIECNVDDPPSSLFSLPSPTDDPWLETPVLHHDESSALQAVEEALTESVNMRIPSKVSWGVLLSGGLDSSLVAALSAQGSRQPVRTFSIGYEGYEKYDERPWAQKCARHLKAQHHSYAFGKREFFETIEEILPLLDEPLGDPAMVPLYFLMKQAAREGVRVLLGGEGGDELFLGYWGYRRLFEYDSLPPLPDSSWLGSYLRNNWSPNREWEWYRRLAEGEVLFRSSAELYTESQIDRLLKLNVPRGANWKAIGGYRTRFENSPRTHPADWYSYIDLKVMLSEVYLLKQDRMAMALGIEPRSPFLDRKMIETVFAIEPELRMQSAPKGLLKKVALRHLPEEIVHRRKKGLNYPFIEWILEEDGIEAIQKAQRRFGLFCDEQLERLWQKADRGKFRQHLFPLYLLARWMNER